MRRTACLSLITAFGTITILVLLGVLALRWSMREYEWSISEVNDVLGVSIPKDASNIVIEGHKGLSNGLPVTFDAPLDTAENFAKQFCGGVLYVGYDPFNAIDTGDPLTYAHEIAVSNFVYYSYSLDVANTILGNRCSPSASKGQYTQIVLDTASPDQIHVKVMAFFSCGACIALPSSAQRWINDLPVWFVGLAQDGANYRLVDRELCIGTMSDANDSYARWGHDIGGKTQKTPFSDYQATEASQLWQLILPATIQIEVDNVSAISGTVNESLQIVDRLNYAREPIPVEASGNERFYCFDPHMDTGSHQMQIQLTAADGETVSYDWAVTAP